MLSLSLTIFFDIASTIRSDDGVFCLVPSISATGGCVIETTSDLLLSSTRCNSLEAKFNYNPSTGKQF